MNKVNRIFQIMDVFLLCIFVIEITMLFSKIDLLPFIIMAVSCGLIILLKHNDEDSVIEESSKKEILFIFFFLLLTLLDVLLLLCFILIGLENISVWVITIFDTNKYIRYLFYGLIYPFLISYFSHWAWHNSRPSLFLDKDVFSKMVYNFYKLLFINCFIGLFICIFWEDYFVLAQGLLFISNF